MEVLLQLGALTGDLEFFSLGKVIVGTVGRIFVDGSHFLDGFAYGREVRKHTARPAFGHIRHIHGGNRLRHDILGLLLRRYEKYATAALGDLLEGCGSLVDLGDGLVQIDDVDPVLLHEDIGSHFGIPLSFQVTEMGAGLQ